MYWTAWRYLWPGKYHECVNCCKHNWEESNFTHNSTPSVCFGKSNWMKTPGVVLLLRRWVRNKERTASTDVSRGHSTHRCIHNEWLQAYSLFVNVKVPERFGSGLDDRPLLTNALLVFCDDVLLFAVNQLQMVILIDLFLTPVSQHRMYIHPGKCDVRSPDHVLQTPSHTRRYHCRTTKITRSQVSVSTGACGSCMTVYCSGGMDMTWHTVILGGAVGT